MWGPWGLEVPHEKIGPEFDVPLLYTIREPLRDCRSIIFKERLRAEVIVDDVLPEDRIFTWVSVRIGCQVLRFEVGSNVELIRVVHSESGEPF